jgi:hypothetical protein
MLHEGLVKDAFSLEPLDELCTIEHAEVEFPDCISEYRIQIVPLRPSGGSPSVLKWEGFSAQDG